MKRGAAKSKAKKMSPARKVSKIPSKAMVRKVEAEMDKRRRNLWIIVAIVGVLVLALLAIALFGSSPSGKVISGYADAATTTTTAVTPGRWLPLVGSNALANALQYIFGSPIQYQGINAISAAIVTIAVWLLLFVTFSDIIASFTSFSKPVAWISGFLIAVITANIGFVVGVATVLTGIFAFAGTFAVFGGLIGALVAFFAVNWGISKLGKFVLRRKAMMLANESEQGGTRLKGAITGLGEAGVALERFGKAAKTGKAK